ncbi:MAG: UDP-N-acetylmuramate dehydrogenase [Clostridium sp.]|nr:UDP-N-acetylmuramate dehydrogenase [Clostridium sp.]
MPYIDRLSEICSDHGCEIRKDEPLNIHTTFRIGGKCRAMVFINSSESLIAISDFLKSEKIKYFVIGRGSNIIAADEGYDGVILLMGKAFSDIRLINETDIFCTSGASLKDVSNFARSNSLAGMEFSYGIPGTCGGALFMNAGAYGGEIKDIVVSAHYLDNGIIKQIDASEMDLSYRHSIFSTHNDYIITDMIFHLEEWYIRDINYQMSEIMAKRRAKQPLEYPSAGSTFKRPEGSYASLLIEQCGLKGMSVGGAQVSEKHSGFVINTGNATCADVIALTDKVIEIVKEKTGYLLELEPLILK